MRRFNVTVNGVPFQVEIEETAAFSAPIAPQPQVISAPVQVSAPQVKESSPAPTPTPATPVALPTSGVKLESPMPGTIVKLVASNGASVKKGDVVVILESMKMETDIVANEAGVITISVVPGQNVNAGDVLAVIS
ncbi:MAG: biotin/lipoyl-binding protein [Christensenellaceae bacterium]|jgi:glutaconyl-CoA decarboxylase|nr:biotin/lipoyl-binding protein [Christensenellaceae bacterium]